MEHWISKAIIHNLEVENPTNHENYKVLVKTLNKIKVYIRTMRNWEFKKVGKGWNNKIAYILGPKRRSIDRSGSKQAAIASAKQKHNWKTRVSDNYYEEGVDENTHVRTWLVEDTRFTKRERVRDRTGQSPWRAWEVRESKDSEAYFVLCSDSEITIHKRWWWLPLLLFPFFPRCLSHVLFYYLYL